MSISIIGVQGIPDIQKGDDLAQIIVERLRRQKEDIRDHDILVISQKVVSKAEGQMIQLDDIRPSAFSRQIAKELQRDPRHVEIILNESKKIIRMKAGHLITETKHGFICANSGVDQSNIGKRNSVTLLPKKPDATADLIRKKIHQLTGKNVPIIITDTFGRAWRMGQVNFAIGISGIKPIHDYRGKTDMYRRVLHVTEIAVADELASAGELVMNKSDKIPVAIIRGYAYRFGKGSGKDLLRPEDKDLFR
jgi:coenzyme F420-0:L-glutamate ligase / coenzyme F420-1:gamma-L-glutamate ligase